MSVAPMIPPQITKEVADGVQRNNPKSCDHVARAWLEIGIRHGWLQGWYASASADRSPEGQDAQRLDAEHESAVAATGGETPKSPKHFRSGGGNASSGNPPPSNHG